MSPHNANPRNFKVQNIIYTSPDGYFSIAKGTWTEDEKDRFAMRWNGDIDDPNDKGYPTVRNHPMWFQLPYDLKDVLNAIIEETQAPFNHNKEITLTVSIQNTQPVELVDLIDMFTGIKREYTKFVSQHVSIQNKKSLRLYLSEVRKGSQIYELISFAPLALHAIEDLNTVFEFAKHLKKIFTKLLGKKDGETPSERLEAERIEPSSAKNFSKILKPVVKDHGSQLILTSTYQENHFHYHLPFNDASVIQKNLLSDVGNTARAISIDTVAVADRMGETNTIEAFAFYREKVVFYWYEEKNNNIPDKGIIESISSKKLKVIFEDDDTEKKIRNPKLIPSHVAYIVDVSVETVQGRPIVYKILKLYEIIEINE